MNEKDFIIEKLNNTNNPELIAFAEYINSVKNDDKECYAKLWHRAYNNISTNSLHEGWRIIFQSNNTNFIIKSICYIRKEFYPELEEYIVKQKSDFNILDTILKNVDSDQIRLKIIEVSDNEEIKISAIMRMKDKNLLPETIKIKYKPYLNMFIRTSTKGTLQ